MPVTVIPLAPSHRTAGRGSKSSSLSLGKSSIRGRGPHWRRRRMGVAPDSWSTTSALFHDVGQRAFATLGGIDVGVRADPPEDGTQSLESGAAGAVVPRHPRGV